jgi:hypothetical protein
MNRWIAKIVTEIVVPAKAGIHFDFDVSFESKIKMDPSLRWDDGVFRG